MKTLNQMKTQTLRQTQINSQLQIPPPESFKESSCKSDNWRKRQRGTNQEKANQNHRTISYISHIHAGTQEF
jgi:hypothetical protein